MNDYELIYLAQEENEIAKELLYKKYAKIINMLIYKKYPKIKKLNIDTKDMYSISLTALNDAINFYNQNQNATFATYLTVVINNSINKYIKKYSSKKEQCLNKALSLDFVYSNQEFLNFILDYKNNPDYCISNQDEIKYLTQKAQKNLSIFEYEVYLLLLQNLNYRQIAKLLGKNPKQIDNAIQRIKNKLKLIKLSWIFIELFKCLWYITIGHESVFLNGGF